MWWEINLSTSPDLVKRCRKERAQLLETTVINHPDMTQMGKAEFAQGTGANWNSFMNRPTGKANGEILSSSPGKISAKIKNCQRVGVIRHFSGVLLYVDWKQEPAYT